MPGVRLREGVHLPCGVVYGAWALHSAMDGRPAIKKSRVHQQLHGCPKLPREAADNCALNDSSPLNLGQMNRV
jgi:hypothetical protein